MASISSFDTLTNSLKNWQPNNTKKPLEAATQPTSEKTNGIYAGNQANRATGIDGTSPSSPPKQAQSGKEKLDEVNTRTKPDVTEEEQDEENGDKEDGAKEVKRILEAKTGDHTGILRVKQKLEY